MSDSETSRGGNQVESLPLWICAVGPLYERFSMYTYQLVCMGSSLGKSPLVLLHFLIYLKRMMGGKDTSSWRQEVIILLLFRSQSFDNFI